MIKNHSVNPIEPPERIILIDIIRGFALLGILLVNAPSINSPIWIENSDFAFKTTTWDAIVTNFIYLFAIDKFYPIFSLLFGLSAIIFMEHIAQQGDNPTLLFIRRMIILFGFGIIHAAFIWWGDILIVYALLGLGLILVYTLSARILLIIVSSLFLILMIIHISLAYYHWQVAYYPDETVVETFMAENLETENREENLTIEETPISDSDEEDMDLIYHYGSFTQIMQKRLEDYYLVSLAGLIQPINVDDFIRYITYYLHIFAIFLLGAWLQKKKIFQHIDDNWHIINEIGIYATIVAFITHLLSAHFDFFEEAFYPISGLSMGMVYIFIITFFFHRKNGQKWLSPLAAMGKMSLSNYLISNLILTLLFYGYGLGLYGTMGPGTQLWITVTLYLILLIFSTLWLKYYRFGPLELIWRVLTYGKISLKSPRNASLFNPLRK